MIKFFKTKEEVAQASQDARAAAYLAPTVADVAREAVGAASVVAGAVSSAKEALGDAAVSAAKSGKFFLRSALGGADKSVPLSSHGVDYGTCSTELNRA